MNLPRLFFAIARVNQVLLLLVLLLALGWLGRQWWRTTPPVPRPVSTSQSTSPLHLSEPEAIRGHPTLLLRLTDEPIVRSYAHIPSEAGLAHNLLFLVGNNAQPRWLFAEQRQDILRVEQLSGDPEDPEEGDTVALYLEYTDSAADPQAAQSDRFNVALVHPDGTGLRVLLPGVEQVYQYQLIDAEQLSVLYQKDRALHQGRFNLKSGAALGDQLLTKLPD